MNEYNPTGIIAGLDLVADGWCEADESEYEQEGAIVANPEVVTDVGPEMCKILLDIVMSTQERLVRYQVTTAQGRNDGSELAELVKEHEAVKGTFFRVLTSVIGEQK